MGDRMMLPRLAGAPVPGDVVLRYNDDINLAGIRIPDRARALGPNAIRPSKWRGSFSVAQNGFDKHHLRQVPEWRWVDDCWRFPASVASVATLKEVYKDTLVLHDSAVSEVKELLGYDPSKIRGRVSYRGGGGVSELAVAVSAARKAKEAIREERGAAAPRKGEEQELSVRRERGVDVVAVLLRIHERLCALDEGMRGLPEVDKSVAALDDRLQNHSALFAARLSAIERRLPA